MGWSGPERGSVGVRSEPVEKENEQKQEQQWDGDEDCGPLVHDDEVEEQANLGKTQILPHAKVAEDAKDNIEPEIFDRLDTN